MTTSTIVDETSAECRIQADMVSAEIRFFHVNYPNLSIKGRLLVQKSIFCYLSAGCRTVSNNGSGSGLASAQNILAVQVWFGFT